MDAAPSIGAMGIVAAKMAHGSAKTMLRGSGAYKVSGRRFAPGVGPPMFRGGGKCVVRHREYLTDIHTGPLSSGSTAFSITRFDLNAGLQHTFPWFSGLGALYEEWHPKGIVLEFKSTCGNAFSSTNNSLGTVVMATEYNAGFPTFTSKIQMENYKGANSGAPTRNIYHAIECSSNQNPLSWLYTRTGDVPDGQTPQVYDLGSFQIATVGMQAAGVNIGELWITYDIELDKPKFSGEGAGDTALWKFSGARLTTDGATVFPRIFGNLPLVASASDLGLRWGGQSPGIDYNTIYFPNRPIKTRYVLIFSYQYTAPDQVATATGICPVPLISVVGFGTGVSSPPNFWQNSATVPALGALLEQQRDGNPQTVLPYYETIVPNVGTPILGASFYTQMVIDVDAFVVGNTNRLNLYGTVSDPTAFDLTFPTGFGWSGSMLVTTVPTGLNAINSVGVPTGPEPEPTGCETNPHSFYIPNSMRKALKQCELNEDALEGKEEKKEEPSDDEKEEEDNVVPSKRNQYGRRQAALESGELRRTDNRSSLSMLKALRDANNLIPDDEDDQPDPLPEEKKAPVSSLLSLSQSMPPPSSVPSGLSTSSSSSLSTPPPGATILTPRTKSRGWFT